DKKVMGKGNDELWNTVLRVELKPDPRLTEAQASVIAHDYGMEGNILQIQTNAALVRYVLDAYNIDINVLDSNPQGQQIIIGNFEELKPYLFC
ncbi:TPA: WYL domain-containing protein, partial [Vibrio parahaemolyticus]|nr:WYL domain-containing protein [Vibrio parahaemolyticus]